MADDIHFHAELHPRKPAVTDLISGQHWNYQQFDRFIAGCVALLSERGIAQGDRVACLSINRAEVIVLHLACARLGAMFVPLNWRLSADELRQLLLDCRPAVVFGDEMADILKNGDSSAQDIEDISQLYHQCSQIAPVWGEQLPKDLPSLILYTSGTTGQPKGVMLSERNLAETAINFTLLGEVDADSTFLCESPMFHIIGMVTSVRPAFLCGGHVVVSDRFIPERTLERLADSALQISHYFCVPQMAVALRAVDNFDPERLRGLKALFTGGAPHPEVQIRQWLDDGIAIVDGYGMSEAGTVFGMPLDRTLIDKKAGCVGIASSRVYARVVDENNHPVGTDAAGELQLKGDNIAIGYWQKEAEFKRAFTDDGWFKTGDVLTVDKDGFYRVTDRKKDMYISGGENVYPAEAEALLINYPGIREAAVVGVPDEKWGEVGCLFYVSETGSISAQDITDFLAPRLAKYKIPQQTYAIDALPRNGVGKIQKHELRRIYKAKPPLLDA